MASSTTLDHSPLEHTPGETDRRTAKTANELLLNANSDQQPVLSVVMPTLNEEDGITTCLNWIKQAIEELQLPAEILISDSSTDRTPELAREQGAIVVTPDEPGYGYAYRYGFARTRGEYIAIGDADTTYDFRQIPRLLAHLKKTGADMVMGSRLEGEIRSGAMPPLHQYIGNPALTKFLNLFYDAGVSDAHSGFRVFTRETWETLECETDGMEFASEMIMEAGAADQMIEEVPIVYHEREGEETLDSFQDGWRHVKFMLVNAPGYLFLIPGLLLTIFGTLVMSGLMFGIPQSSISLGTNSMIAGSLFVILGVQVGSLGIFATVFGDPIQKPGDALTRVITEQLSLERGATVGLAVFTVGAAYATWLIGSWVASGFGAVPFTMSALVAFTAIVIGAQIVFSSFFLSSVR